MEHFLCFAVARTKRRVQFEMIDVIQECGPNGEEYVLQSAIKQCISSIFSSRPVRARHREKSVREMSSARPATHLELTRMVELAEVGLQLERLLQILQKLTLKCDNVLDVAEQCIYLGVR